MSIFEEILILILDQLQSAAPKGAAGRFPSFLASETLGN